MAASQATSKRSKQAKLQLGLLIAWLVMVPISVFLGWVESVAFVAACSLYANAAAHWGAYEAAQAKDEASSDGTP